MSAANVTTFNSKPAAYIIPNEIKIVMGIEVAATAATRTGIKNTVTSTTEIMAISISIRNSSTDFCTTFD